MSFNTVAQVTKESCSSWWFAASRDARFWKNNWHLSDHFDCDWLWHTKGEIISSTHSYRNSTF